MTNATSHLSLEQRASLLSGSNFWNTKSIEEAGIAALVLTDGPHGVRRQSGAADHLGINDSEPSTCFPPAVAVGSGWDPQLAARLGEALATEARALGVHILLGPGINIKRSPLCGRNFEYYSEDPLLSGVLGAAHVRALQGGGVGASVKHFAANNQETERMRVSADVDERALREIYLPAFERVVTEADPATVMCSYNKINGVYASQNRWLLTDVLRDEWGYTGAVVSDWGAVSDRVAGVAAGMDLEMPGSGGLTDAQIVDAVKNGALDESFVAASAERVAALNRYYRSEPGSFDVDAHHALAREVAAECIVLLRNRHDVLPLQSEQSIVVFGDTALHPQFQGGGSSHINATRVDTPLVEIEKLAANRNSTVVHLTEFDAAAEEATRAADVAVVFVAGPHETEGSDRDALELAQDSAQLVRSVAEVASRTVVVLSNGGVLTIDDWAEHVDAIVEGWLLGQAAGGALADILFGVVNPSGHLAETIPTSLRATPSYLNFPGEQAHVRYGEGVFVGYRHYTTLGSGARYHFGHGLSYTTFSTEKLDVEITGPDTVDANVTVTNTGERAGKHVVQVYVSTDAGPVRRPVRELRAFSKVFLEPGESKTISLSLDRRAFAYWDVELHRWIVPAGEFGIEVGQDSSTIVARSIVTLDGDVIVKPLSLQSTVEEWFSHPAAGPALQEALAAGMSEAQQAQSEENAEGLAMVASMPMAQFLAFIGAAIPAGFLDDLIRQSHDAATV